MKRLPRLAKRYVIGWLPLFWTITILVGFGYAAVQQSIRQGANDLPVQLTETAVERAANSSTSLMSLTPDEQADISASLAPFVIVYDDNTKPLVGSGYLDGSLPGPPAGVFNFVRAHGIDRVTWQPRNDVRIATVVRQLTDKDGHNRGFVLAGRNMKEIERQESQVLALAAAAWLLASVGSLGLIIIIEESKL